MTFIAPNTAGQVDLNALAHAVGTKTALCACIHVNNEIGTVLDVATLAREVKAKNSRTAVHVDGVQAWCRLPFKVGATMIDTYSVSGHKIHAPKGVGALYVRRGFYTEPLMFGGEQEKGMRPGTQNTPYIAALGKAVQLVQADKGRAERVRTLNRPLWRRRYSEIARTQQPGKCSGRNREFLGFGNSQRNYAALFGKQGHLCFQRVGLRER